MINTEHQTSTKPSLCVHGTPEWCTLWKNYHEGFGRAAWLIDRMQSDAVVYGHGLERDEGYEQCLAMLNEAEAAIQKAKDARRRIKELTKAPEQHEVIRRESAS